MKNKKGNVAVFAIIIVIVAITASVITWMLAKTLQAPEQQPIITQSVARIPSEQQPIPTITPVQAVPIQKSSVNWSAIQFDACGKKEKYKTMPWWNKLIVHIETFNDHNNNPIGKEVKTITQDVIESPAQYTGDPDFGEGCLSKDGSVFIMVFPGEYGGGGNYTFRYSINDNIFEEATRVNDSLASDPSWFDPPSEFGKRTGNTIKMHGSSGDAGCSVKSEYDYNLAENQIKKIKRCSQCDEEKPVCETF